MVNPLAAELENNRRAPPCSLIIFGATGDLTRRKLMPSLAGLHCDGLLPSAFSVVGFARRDKSDEDFRNDLREGMVKHGREGSQDSFKAMEPSIYYHQSTFEDPDGYATLSKRLSQIEQESGTHGNRIFYLATPPSAYSGILKNLKDSGLSKEVHGRFSRVIVEKPFGRGRKTAEALNTQVAASFDEDQVYRIDHYLGKETVQNILAMRFANGIYEPLWNQNYIDHVQITVAESIGVGSRGRYF
ncbi:MAG: glucose-6-phosphate dehydrogenase, partial [Myxococcota bacterium]